MDSTSLFDASTSELGAWRRERRGGRILDERDGAIVRRRARGKTRRRDDAIEDGIARTSGDPKAWRGRDERSSRGAARASRSSRARTAHPDDYFLFAVFASSRGTSAVASRAWARVESRESRMWEALRRGRCGPRRRFRRSRAGVEDGAVARGGAHTIACDRRARAPRWHHRRIEIHRL